MPGSYEGKFSGILTAAAAVLEAAAPGLGLKRVTLGNFSDSDEYPQAWLAPAAGAATPTPESPPNQRPATLWTFPLRLVIVKEYATPNEVVDAVLLTERTMDALRASASLGGLARGVRFNALEALEGKGKNTPYAVSVSVDFSYLLSIE